MVVRSTIYSDIIFDSELEILQVIWKQKPTDSVFVDTYLHGLNFVQEVKPIQYYCTDLTQSGPLDREQEEWLNNFFYGKLHETLKAEVFVAVVFSDEHFKAIVTNYTATKLANLYDFLHFNYFTEKQEAYFWLESVKKGQDAILFPAFQYK
ncbi:hypothetical protein WG947_00550 [Pontibacter sp. H259]|uniref:hypothetical protein n=1 Tax=Pontibacter sp. H259 TaxID=3133421 RepID=UPI0030BA7608